MLHGSSAVRHALGLQRTQVLPDLTKIPPDLYRQAWAMLTKVPEGFHIDSKKEIARWFFGALGIVLACTFLGKLWDLLLPPNKGQRIPRWVVTMVVSSYILMFPGISELFKEYFFCFWIFYFRRNLYNSNSFGTISW